MYKYQMAILDKYNCAKFDSVMSAYAKPSASKRNAERRILSTMKSLNGYDYRVTSKNTFAFSCGFRYVNKDDNKEHLAYYTSCNAYDFPIQ